LKVKKMILFSSAALLLGLGGPVMAQTSDESEVILPLEAQTCNLPSAPARIPEDADLPALAKAKAQIGTFQEQMLGYRECLDQSRGLDNLTEGNEVALTRAHNYSVEMEERVAEQFNAAVRAYKERKAEQ
jgi:hypothetical protein